jgi:hypothetical protein
MRRRVRRRRRSEAAYRVEIPLPLVDNRGRRFPPRVFTWLEGRLLQLSYGFRVHRDAYGVWQNDVRVFREPVATYVITIKERRYPDLERLLIKIRSQLRQHAVLAERQRVQMTLVKEGDAA